MQKDRQVAIRYPLFADRTLSYFDSAKDQLFGWNKGIHVHAFKTPKGPPAIDETFSAVVIDGVKLDPQQVRVLMAQRTLPSLRSRVASIDCPECAAQVFENGLLAFTPQMTHTCPECGARFTAKGRLRKTIGNPLAGILLLLAKSAPRVPQHHELTL